MQCLIVRVRCASARSTLIFLRATSAGLASSLGSAPVRHKVYTKTGDAGSSSLYNGERRAKDDAFFSALGDVDELNASVGLAREHCAASGVGIEAQLVEIQSRLLDAGSAIATPTLTSSPEQLARAAFPSGIVAALESWIDEFDAELPPLKNFILPVRGRHWARERAVTLYLLTLFSSTTYTLTHAQSGGLASSQLHVSRTICRRAERFAVTLVRDGQLDASVAVFLNRLSDYLFMAARVAAKRSGKEEVVYKKKVEVKTGSP